MQITASTHVVLWSPHQKCFHVETFESMLATNRKIFAEQNVGDYIVLALASSREEANDITVKLRASSPVAEDT